MTLYKDISMNINRRKVIAVDGPNGGGKSTVIKLIKLFLPGATVIEHHDYFHKHIARTEKQELWKRENWKNLSQEAKSKGLNYIMARDDNTVVYIKHIHNDDVLLERFLLTGMVYCKLLGFDSQKYFEHAASMLRNMSDVIFIYVSCEEELLVQRNQKISPKQIIRKNSCAPYHLIDESVIRKKHELYDDLYNKLQINKKLFIDSGEMSEGEIKEVLLSKIVN